MTRAIHTVLIANRGEIACRIARSCRLLGLGTVAVHSQADAGVLHTTCVDRAVQIGPAAARESYLDIDRVLAAARDTGADAVHPVTTRLIAAKRHYLGLFLVTAASPTTCAS